MQPTSNSPASHLAYKANLLSEEQYLPNRLKLLEFIENPWFLHFAASLADEYDNAENIIQTIDTAERLPYQQQLIGRKAGLLRFETIVQETTNTVNQYAERATNDTTNGKSSLSIAGAGIGLDPDTDPRAGVVDFDLD